MTINIKIKNQLVIAETTQRIIANSVNHVTAICSFDEEWDGCTKNLIFTNGDISKMILVKDEKEFTVPYEVLIPGKLEISAVGYSENGEKRITTKKTALPLTVFPSGELTGDTPENYTPELWEQISAAVGDMADLNVNAETLVEAINKILESSISGGIEIKTDSSGFYHTVQTVGNASTYYIHDKETLEKSQNILRLEAAALSFSSNGGITYPYQLILDDAAVQTVADNLSAHKNNLSNPHKVTISQIGAAPSGYGLGDLSCILTEPIDRVWANGTYQWSTAPSDAPFSWSTMQVLNRNSQTAVQIAHSIAKTYAEPIARRLRLNNQPGEWEYFNPPTLIGTEYLTTEIWADKSVYVKLINFGSLPNNSVKTVAHDASATAIIRAYGTTSQGTAIPCKDKNTSGAANTIDMCVNTTNIKIITDYNASANTAVVAIWYTKD